MQYLFFIYNFLSKVKKHYRRFRSVYSCTVNDYITDRRINEAKRLLTDSTESVQRISGRVGFENTTYFSKLFKKKTGLTPNQYRKIK